MYSNNQYSAFMQTQIQAQVQPPKAFLISYEHVNDEEIMRSNAVTCNKLSAEGYEVSQLQIKNNQLALNRAGEPTTQASHLLKQHLNYLKGFEKSKLVFTHHGSPTNKGVLSGSTTGSLLSRHGLTGNLKGMEIDYTPCYGSTNGESKKFTTEIGKNAAFFSVEALNKERHQKIDEPKMNLPPSPEQYKMNLMHGLQQIQNDKQSLIQHYPALQPEMIQDFDKQINSYRRALNNIPYEYSPKGSCFAKAIDPDPTLPDEFNKIFVPAHNVGMDGLYEHTDVHLVDKPQTNRFGMTTPSITDSKNPYEIAEGKAQLLDKSREHSSNQARQQQQEAKQSTSRHPRFGF